MFTLPKVKKALTGLISVKHIKSVIAGVAIATGVMFGAVPTDANATASQSQAAPSFQAETTGALLLTPSFATPMMLADHESHYSHSSHASHESHASHASHYSSRW